MTKILIDHNLEGQAVLLAGMLNSEGWTELLSIRFVSFSDAGLAADSSDRTLWRFAQENQMLLLTDNRNMEGADSLEQTIRDENTSESMPVLTIGNISRFVESEYRKRCATRLIEIICEIEHYKGARRLFIP